MYEVEYHEEEIDAQSDRMISFETVSTIGARSYLHAGVEYSTCEYLTDRLYVGKSPQTQQY